MSESGLPHFVELRYPDLESMLSDMGERPYRAGQIWAWAYKKFASGFDDMSDLPLALRKQLAEHLEFARLERLVVQEGDDGEAQKYLWGLYGRPLAESVLMKYAYGLSACLSCAAGCPVGCAFCASSKLGFERNLTKGEIVEEYLGMCRESGQRIGHVVFMGTGEPFLNYEAVLGAMEALSDPRGTGISRRRFTVSTVGIPGGMRRYGKDSKGARLALSLHATEDSVRERLIPVNSRYPIREILGALREYAGVTGQRVTVEYMLLDGVNDSDQDASKLCSLLAGIDCLVNLISWNKVPGLPFARSGEARVRSFFGILERNHQKVTIRRSLGGEIEAACGQLRRVATDRRPRS